MPIDRDAARLAVARHAARLFLEKGTASASGDEIAAAAGLSTRTVWRHFRTKETCVEPLFTASHRGFLAKLRRWPREASIETHLAECFRLDRKSAQEIADEVLIVRLIAIMDEEPALRGVWLMSCHETEAAMVEIVADRLDRSVKDFEVRLCAATVVAAIRVVDETISIAAIRHGQTFTMADVVEQMAKTLRAASTLPICDPQVPNPFGAMSGPREAPAAGREPKP